MQCIFSGVLGLILIVTSKAKMCHSKHGAGKLLGIHKMLNGAFGMLLLTACVLIRLLSAHLLSPLDQPYMWVKETASPPPAIGVKQELGSVTISTDAQGKYLKA